MTQGGGWQKKVREKEVQKEGNCLSRSCKLLGNLNLLPFSTNFHVIFTYANVIYFFSSFFKLQNGETNTTTHEHISQTQEILSFPFSPSITMCPSSWHLWLKSDLVTGCSSPAVDHFHQEWGEDGCFGAFSFLRGVLMRVEDGVKPVLEWLYRQPPPPAASIIAQLWISGSDTR